MSEAEAAAAGAFAFKTAEDGFVVGDRRFADRAEAETYSTEKKAELAQHQEEAKARRAARTKEYFDNRAAGKRRYRVVTRLSSQPQWCTPEEADVRRSEEGVVSVEPAESLFVVTRRVGDREEQRIACLGDDEVEAIQTAPGTVAIELAY